MNNTIIATDQSSPAFGPFSQAVVKDGFLHSSGLMPFLPGSGDLISDDLEEQMHQCMRNMKAVLAAAEMTIDDLVLVTIYTTDMQQFANINKVYGEAFDQPYPARSTIEVSALPKGGKVEIEAIIALE